MAHFLSYLCLTAIILASNLSVGVCSSDYDQMVGRSRSNSQPSTVCEPGGKSPPNFGLEAPQFKPHVIQKTADVFLDSDHFRDYPLWTTSLDALYGKFKDVRFWSQLGAVAVLIKNEGSSVDFAPFNNACASFCEITMPRTLTDPVLSMRRAHGDSWSVKVLLDALGNVRWESPESSVTLASSVLQKSPPLHSHKVTTKDLLKGLIEFLQKKIECLELVKSQTGAAMQRENSNTGDDVNEVLDPIVKLSQMFVQASGSVLTKESLRKILDEGIQGEGSAKEFVQYLIGLLKCDVQKLRLVFLDNGVSLSLAKNKADMVRALSSDGGEGPESHFASDKTGENLTGSVQPDTGGSLGLLYQTLMGTGGSLEQLRELVKSHTGGSL